MVGKRKYIIHSIVTELFSVLMNRFFLKKIGIHFFYVPQTHLQMKMVQYLQVLHSSDLERLLWIID